MVGEIMNVTKPVWHFIHCKPPRWCNGYLVVDCGFYHQSGQTKD